MPSVPTLAIPRIIHQTWRDTEVPRHWRAWQSSWRRHHPGWRYVLWTDADLRMLIREHYPWFLTIYDNYRDPIQRVDAARYFLTNHCGGVYADLDFECLRPLDEMLRSRTLVFGLEPEAHLQKTVVRAQGLSRVVGNAFIASRPRHPFWEHLFRELVGTHDVADPLASTGPFLLTRALESWTVDGDERAECVPPALLYPGSSDEAVRGLLVDPGWRATNAANAYAIHHWSGSWIEQEQDAADLPDDPESAAISVVHRGVPLFAGDWRLPDATVAEPAPTPFVSCLMVTRSDRLAFARRAIACFQSQSHPQRELVILDDGASEDLARHVESLDDATVRLERLAPENLALGALRNLAVEHAAGGFVMQWDDDDLYHPRRIEVQLAALLAMGAEACLLSRWQLWWPQQRRFAVSKVRGWEGSILCRRDKLPRYDDWRRRGEDTPVVLRLASREKVAFLDAPWLYTYIVHGTNTTDAQGLSEHWSQATESYWNATYAPAVRLMTEPLPHTVRAEVRAGLEEQAVPPPANAHAPTPLSPLTGQRKPAAALPRVLVLTPVKNGVPFIDTYVSLLAQLDYPPDRLALAILESDSTDGTRSILQSKLEALRGRLERVELFERDFGLHLVGSRSEEAVQAQRRSVLARSRNYLLSRALRDEEWVLWIDFDLVEYPPDALRRLLATGKDVVVPHCVLAPGGRTFDLNTFISVAEPDSPSPAGTMHGGAALAQPARGEGRIYLEHVRDQDLVEVDGVGGTMLLVRADLHREGLVFPAVPYKRHLETEGLAFLARDLGVRCWGMPSLEIVHANH